MSLVLPCSNKCLMDMGAGLYLLTEISQDLNFIFSNQNRQFHNVTLRLNKLNNKPAVAVQHIRSFSVKHFWGDLCCFVHSSWWSSSTQIQQQALEELKSWETALNLALFINVLSTRCYQIIIIFTCLLPLTRVLAKRPRPWAGLICNVWNLRKILKLKRASFWSLLDWESWAGLHFAAMVALGIFEHNCSVQKSLALTCQVYRFKLSLSMQMKELLIFLSKIWPVQLVPSYHSEKYYHIEYE